MRLRPFQQNLMGRAGHTPQLSRQSDFTAEYCFETHFDSERQIFFLFKCTVVQEPKYVCMELSLVTKNLAIIRYNEV